MANQDIGLQYHRLSGTSMVPPMGIPGRMEIERWTEGDQECSCEVFVPSAPFPSLGIANIQEVRAATRAHDSNTIASSER